MTYKVAIIGTGNIAKKNHIPALQQDERVEIIALCGRDLEKTQVLAKENQIAYSFDSVEKLFAQIQPDIVINTTPNNLHYPITMQALEHNCHVLCEKPPALTAKQAQEMADLSYQKGKVLAYNLQLRQSPEFCTLKKMHQNGKLGQIYHIKANFLRRRGIPGWGNFTNKAIQGGGALMDLGVHVLDLALDLLNYQIPDKIVANTYDLIGKSGGKGLMGQWNAEAFEVEDACTAYLSFPDNSSIILSAAFALNAKKDIDRNLEIFGSKAGATLFPLTIYGENEGELSDISFPFLEETDYQLKNTKAFLDACDGKPHYICTSQQGAILQEIVEKIYASTTINK